MSFSERLTDLRKKSGMTQEQLAEKIGVTRQTVSKWELNQSTPDLNYISQMCDLFEVTSDYLIKGAEVKNEAVKSQRKVKFKHIGITIVGILLIWFGLSFVRVDMWIEGLAIAFIGAEFVAIKRKTAIGIICATLSMVFMALFMIIIPNTIEKIVITGDSHIYTRTFGFSFDVSNTVWAVNMSIAVFMGLTVGLKKHHLYSEILFGIATLSMVHLTLFGGCKDFGQILLPVIFYGVTTFLILVDCVEKRKYIKIVIICSVCLLLATFTAVFIGGTNTAKAQNFNNYLTSREWHSVSGIGDGNMMFEMDGGFSYTGPDGGGPFGYDLFEYYIYNSILDKIIVYDSTDIEFVDIIDYDLDSMTLDIEGYAIEFEGVIDIPSKPNYENSKSSLLMLGEEYIKSSTGACNVLIKQDGELLCTVEGYEREDLGNVTFKLADDVKYEKLVVTLLAGGDAMGTDGSYELEYKELADDEVKEMIEKFGYSEYLWCNENGEVEKVLFYKVYIEKD